MSREEDICWYHGKLSRSEAEIKLKEGRPLEIIAL